MRRNRAITIAIVVVSAMVVDVQAQLRTRLQAMAYVGRHGAPIPNPDRASPGRALEPPTSRRRRCHGFSRRQERHRLRREQVLGPAFPLTPPPAAASSSFYGSRREHSSRRFRRSGDLRSRTLRHADLRGGPSGARRSSNRFQITTAGTSPLDLTGILYIDPRQRLGDDPGIAPRRRRNCSEDASWT
jgi:hypothetical protein